MADLFTHVLAGFVLAVVLSWKFEWITPPLVAVAMVGAAIPDLNRLSLVLPESTIEAVIGVPWSWTVFHRAGGALLVIVILATLVRRAHVKPVFAMLLLGATSHFVLDYLLWQPSGTTSLMLWPFADWHLDFGGFYRSSDRWPAVVAIAVASFVWALDRRVFGARSG